MQLVFESEPIELSKRPIMMTKSKHLPEFIRLQFIFQDCHNFFVQLFLNMVNRSGGWGERDRGNRIDFFSHDIRSLISFILHEWLIFGFVERKNSIIIFIGPSTHTKHQCYFFAQRSALFLQTKPVWCTMRKSCSVCFWNAILCKYLHNAAAATATFTAVEFQCS